MCTPTKAKCLSSTVLILLQLNSTGNNNPVLNRDDFCNTPAGYKFLCYNSTAFLKIIKSLCACLG